MKLSKNRTLSLASLFIFGLFFVFQMTYAQSKADKIDELLQTYANYNQFSGSILVSEKGKVIYKKAFGFANYEWDIPNKTNTKFRLASVTKQFTALLILQLASENIIDINKPITTYLPDYPSENGDKITLHHLLTHSSGLPNYTSLSSYRKIMKSGISPIDLMHSFSDSTLNFNPGERFRYSNSGYVLLGVIMEKMTGKSFAELLQEKIFDPLKMTNSGYFIKNKLIKNKANGYNKQGSVISNSNYIDLTAAYTAGGIYSTVEDLFLWDQALYNSTLLPTKELESLFTPHIKAWGEHYSYGWLVGKQTIGNSEKTINTIWHDGVVNGFNSIISRFPDDKSSIIVLNNTGNGPLKEISKAIRGILYNESYDFPKQSLAYSLQDIIEVNGIEKGWAFYKKKRKDNSYYMAEHEINRASYYFLESKHPELALEILKIGIEEYPNAFNLYDSYGEVLMNQGKSKEAIENYKKSLELNPNNKNGIKMLEKLGVDINPEDLFLLKSEDKWGKEIFNFPIHFAPEISYKGKEEAYFPRGWSKVENPEFWSYVFAWHINLNKTISQQDLETNLGYYFDGLLKGVNKNKDFTLPKTTFNLTPSTDLNNFTGTIDIFDTFVTNKPLTLFVEVKQDLCGKSGTSILIFRFSPKPFSHNIWNKLQGLKVNTMICE